MRPSPSAQASRGWNWSAITSLITGVTAIGALVFTGLSLNATREQTAVTEQAQITDHYSKAVEQVGRQGPDNLQIRLGGIYALERLARDSPRDQPTIIEVLSVFVRTNAHPPFGTPCPREPPNADVQAALTVLGRRNPDQDHEARIDLGGICLAFVKLHDARLDKADLTGADLTGANLDGASAKVADFGGAHLKDASFNGAELSGARFNHADLTGAGMYAAILTTASFVAADLTTASLQDARLDYAYLSGSHLAGTNLHGADLSHAYFEGVDLRDTKHDDRTRTGGAKTDDKTLGRWW